MTRQRAGGRSTFPSNPIRSTRRRRRNRRAVAPRRLRLEPVEPRMLLASITGTVLDDLTGNGFTVDDSPLTEPVTLRLIHDANDNGLNDDGPFRTTPSDPATGQFLFDGVLDGRYFLSADEPAGATQSAGPAFYEIEVVNDQVFQGPSLVVDDFDDPAGVQTYLISQLNSNPYSALPRPSELANVDRMLTVAVAEPAGLLSASGSIGGGYYDFGTLGPRPAVATITYDAAASPVDLTANGSNTALRLDLLDPETGVDEPDLPIDILATSTGGTATFQDAIGFVPLEPLSYLVDFGQFSATPGFSFEEVTDLQIVLGSPNLANVDFRLTTVAAADPMAEGYDFGFFTEARITGQKTLDTDGDRQGDQPMAGVTIELWEDVDCDGELDGDDTMVAETQTGADGSYVFSELENDTCYLVREDVPDGHIQVGGQTVYAFEVVNNVVYAGGSLGIDDFDNPDPAATYVITALNANPFTDGPRNTDIAGLSRTLVVEVSGPTGLLSASGQIGAGTLNFGATNPAGTAPTATLDYTAASSVDLTDGGAADSLRFDFSTVETGVGEPDLGLSVMMTGGGGTATFTGAIPVQPNQPTSYLLPFSAFTTVGGFSFDDVDEIEIVLNTGDQPNLDLELVNLVAARPQSDGYDFVNACADSQLSGYVYVDANDNGVREAIELPIPGVTVTLTGTDVYGSAVNRSVATDAAGFYEFTGLVAGSYTVIETQPADYLPGRATPGTLGGTASADGNVISGVEIVGCQQNSLENNFGELGLRFPSKTILLFPFGLWAPVNPPDGSDNTDAVQTDMAVLSSSAADDVIELAGTEGADTFVYDARTGTATITTSDGRVQTITAKDAALRFNAGGGEDTVTLTGTEGGETFSLGPHSGSLAGATFAVSVFDAEKITVDALGGDDEAVLSDSAGNDELKVGPGRGWLYGQGFFHHFRNFDRVTAAAEAGGFDVAYFYDSRYDDLFTATPAGGVVEGPGFRLEADGFDAVHAYASAGGYDRAVLHDSDGNDTFVGAKSESKLYGDGFFSRAKYFETVSAVAGDGFDVARLFDSVGDDTFEASPAVARLHGQGFDNRASNFEAVHGYAEMGGDDVAYLSGSADDDVLVAGHVDTQIYNRGVDYYLRAKFFEQVFAEGGGGNDAAELQDSSGDDHLTVGTDWVKIDWLTARSLTVGDFDFVTARSSHGGTDYSSAGSGDYTDYVLSLEGPWVIGWPDPLA